MMTSVNVKNLGNTGATGKIVTEQILYGENTAVGIIMAALEAENVGVILHINDEITRLLGHKRKDVIGKKVNNIQPSPISDVHDNILRRFLNSA